ncbi:hypothetical protein HDU87_007009 [Geranomyces variabilis]|uniref:C2H2-type domain-containing protein n=1 Tax=Geranomyces variabilis TaxID=109894 RepID=A0AAD5XQ61_9FUNG|nr:hypothetical protein HDU87_007009 [Geranomyces variabilis]
MNRDSLPATPVMRLEEEFYPSDELEMREPEATFVQIRAAPTNWPEGDWYPYQPCQATYLPPPDYFGVPGRYYLPAPASLTLLQQPAPNPYAVAPQVVNQAPPARPSSNLQILQDFHPWSASAAPPATGFAFVDSPPMALTSLLPDDLASSSCEGSCAFSPYEPFEVEASLAFEALSAMTESPNRNGVPTTLHPQSSPRSPTMHLKTSPKPSSIREAPRKSAPAPRKSARLARSKKTTSASASAITTSSSTSPSPKYSDRFVHICPHCPDKRFTRKYNLLAHIRSAHSFEKPFKCHLCPQQFARKYDFDRHAVSCHWEVKPFGCSKCGRRFARSDALKKHSRRKKCRSSDVGVKSEEEDEE